MITIDAEKGVLDVDLDEKELEKRRRQWKAPNNPYKSGALWKYAQQVGPARYGAVTHPGGKSEEECYAEV
jgi:dihydroxy-acid dehydratase